MKLYQPFLLVALLPLAIFSSFAENGLKPGAKPADSSLTLNMRKGTPPTVPPQVPHQQLDQNSPIDMLKALKTFLFSLDHVEEKSSQLSFPSARAAVIQSAIPVNPAINREFTHIHMEPGPGSQHLTLKDTDSEKVLEAGWGVVHPWNKRLAQKGYTLMMIYAPRNHADLTEIQKIIQAAYQTALDVQ